MEVNDCLFFHTNNGNEICFDRSSWIYFVAFTGFAVSSLLGIVLFIIKNMDFVRKKIEERGGWVIVTLLLILAGSALYWGPSEISIKPLVQPLSAGVENAFAEGVHSTSVKQKVLILLCFGYGFLSSATFSHGQAHSEKAYGVWDALFSFVIIMVSEVFKVAVYILTFSFSHSRLVLFAIFIAMVGLFAANAYFELMFRHKYNPEFTYGNLNVKARPKLGFFRFIFVFFGHFRKKVEASALGLTIFLYGLVALIDEFE